MHRCAAAHAVGAGHWGCWWASVPALLGIRRCWMSGATEARRQRARDRDDGHVQQLPKSPVAPDVTSDTPGWLNLSAFIEALHKDPRVLSFGKCPSQKLEINDLREHVVVTLLDRLGLDGLAVAQQTPNVLHADVTAMEATAQFLRKQRVDVVAAVHATPYMLLRDVAHWQLAWDTVATCGIDPAGIVCRQPAMLLCAGSEFPLALPSHKKRDQTHQRFRIFFISRDALAAKAAFLASLKLDATGLLRIAPRTFSLDIEHMRGVVQYLEKFDLDISRTLTRAPQILERRVETLQRKVQFLTENRLDVNSHIHGCPQVLLYSVERKLQPALNFVVQEMGRPIAEVNATPTLWRYSLEGRLRPRAGYLRALQRDGCSLDYFLRLPERTFANSVAGRRLSNFLRWKQKNGYASP
eukprot:GGOE01001076.1.p1 GENE.GGOE01001076.1~~GGOE01001076.1.p1  ORF type:complete len:411 (+),score=71.56 GGOE01001076.1:72-1304(+)